MSNKEKLIEFILKLSDDDAEKLYSQLSPKQSESVWSKYHGYIYSIKHNITGKEYIGFTEHYDDRIKSHLSALRGGRHRVEDMQADFDKYGENYTISVLEEITEYSQRCREYELMKSRGSYIREKGYNYKDEANRRRPRPNKKVQL